MIKRNSLLLMLTIIISSCGNKSFNTAEEISAFISEEDNGYKYSKEVNGVNYSVQYRPTDLMVQQELVGKSNEQDIIRLRDKYSKNLYFNLSMSIEGKELLSNTAIDRNKFNQLVNDLVFNMPEKVALLSAKKDTLSIIDCIYPRMYGMSNSTTILIIYPRDKEILNEEFIYFIIQDLGLNTGEIKFKIPTKQLNKEPKLNFKN